MNRIRNLSSGAVALAIATTSACAMARDSDEAAELASSPSELVAPSPVQIVRVKAFGSGCPSTTYDANISPHGRSVRIHFSGYSLERTADRQSLNCSVTLELDVPPGTSVAVNKVALSGYAKQTASVSSEVFVSHTFVGGTGSGPGATSTNGAFPEFRRLRPGPTDGDFRVRDLVDDNRLTFSACGGLVEAIIDTRLVLRYNANGEGSVSLYDLDEVGFTTRPCGAPDAVAREPTFADAGIVDADAVDAGADQERDAGSDTTDAGSYPDGQTVQPDARAVINRVSARGALCPSGSLESAIIENGSDVDLSAPSAIPSLSRFTIGGCVVSLAVTPPAGHKFTVDRFEACAAVALEDMVQPELTSSFWFTGSTADQESEAKTVLAFPQGEFPFASDFASDQTRLYSSCGQLSQLNVRLQAALPLGANGRNNTVRVRRFTGLKLHLEPCTN